MRRKLITYLPSVIVAAGILYLSLIKAVPFTLPPVSAGDKWAHALAYAVFAITMCADSRRYRGEIGKVSLIVALALAVIYGGVIELLQKYCFPPRMGEWLDWLADSVGALIGIGVFLLVERIRSQRRK